MGENGDTRITGGGGSTVPDDNRTKLRFGRVSAAIGVVFAVVGTVASVGGGAAGISAGVLGFVLGTLGYFLGSSRLGTTAIVLSVAALFFGLAASQGMIPGT